MVAAFLFMATSREHGYVLFWRESKSGGWGFLRSVSGKKFFFHKTGVLNGQPTHGQRVAFTALPKSPGKPWFRATEIEILDPQKEPSGS